MLRRSCLSNDESCLSGSGLLDASYVYIFIVGSAVRSYIASNTIFQKPQNRNDERAASGPRTTSATCVSTFSNMLSKRILAGDEKPFETDETDVLIGCVSCGFQRRGLTSRPARSHTSYHNFSIRTQVTSSLSIKSTNRGQQRHGPPSRRRILVQTSQPHRQRDPPLEIDA